MTQRSARIHARAALRDGTPVCIRPVRPDDKERLRIAFERLSPETVYRRFFHPKKALTSQDLRTLTQVDFRDHVALAVIVEETNGERLIAVGRFVRVAPGADRAEIGVTVVDEYQRRGAGTLVLQQLVAIARSIGVRELVALVLDDNCEMLEVIRNLHLPTQRTIDEGFHRIVLSVAGSTRKSIASSASPPADAASGATEIPTKRRSLADDSAIPHCYAALVDRDNAWSFECGIESQSQA